MNTINLHPITCTMVMVSGIISIATPFPAVAWVVSRACVFLAGSWSELPAVQQLIASHQFMALLLHFNSILKVGAGQFEKISFKSQVVLELEALV